MTSNTIRLGALVLASILAVACQRTCPVAEPKSGGGGTPQCDRLSPVLSVLTSENYAVARDDAALGELLFSRVPQRSSMNIATAEELVLSLVKEDPRTEVEAVYVLRTPPRPNPPEYRAVHARAKQYVVSGPADAGADFWEAPIDAEAVRALERSWGTMARGARWPGREQTIRQMKWGGVVGTYEYRGDNVYGQGYSVSPEAGSCAAELTILGDLLIRYADEPDPAKRQPIRAELLRRAKALSARLQASGEPLVGEP